MYVKITKYKFFFPTKFDKMKYSAPRGGIFNILVGCVNFKPCLISRVARHNGQLFFRSKILQIGVVIKNLMVVVEKQLGICGEFYEAVREIKTARAVL